MSNKNVGEPVSNNLSNLVQEITKILDNGITSTNVVTLLSKWVMLVNSDYVCADRYTRAGKSYNYKQVLALIKPLIERAPEIFSESLKVCKTPKSLVLLLLAITETRNTYINSTFIYSAKAAESLILSCISKMPTNFAKDPELKGVLLSIITGATGEYNFNFSLDTIIKNLSIANYSTISDLTKVFDFIVDLISKSGSQKSLLANLDVKQSLHYLLSNKCITKEFVLYFCSVLDHKLVNNSSLASILSSHLLSVPEKTKIFEDALANLATIPNAYRDFMYSQHKVFDANPELLVSTLLKYLKINKSPDIVNMIHLLLSPEALEILVRELIKEKDSYVNQVLNSIVSLSRINSNTLQMLTNCKNDLIRNKAKKILEKRQKKEPKVRSLVMPPAPTKKLTHSTVLEIEPRGKYSANDIATYAKTVLAANINDFGKSKDGKSSKFPYTYIEEYLQVAKSIPDAVATKIIRYAILACLQVHTLVRIEQIKDIDTEQAKIEVTKLKDLIAELLSHMILSTKELQLMYATGLAGSCEYGVFEDIPARLDNIQTYILNYPNLPKETYDLANNLEKNNIQVQLEQITSGNLYRPNIDQFCYSLLCGIVTTFKNKNTPADTYQHYFDAIIRLSNKKVSVARQVLVGIFDLISDLGEDEDSESQSVTAYDILSDSRLSTESLEKLSEILGKDREYRKLAEIITNAMHSGSRRSEITSDLENTVVLHRSLTPAQSDYLKTKINELPDKDILPWGLVNKVLNVPQQPKEVQSSITALKSKHGTVAKSELLDLVNKLVKGTPYYDIGIASYDGTQTIHEKLKTVVLQLNVRSELWHKVSTTLSKDEVAILNKYITAISDPSYGHPVVSGGKTFAWARVTKLTNTLIVEELQSDILNEENILVYLEEINPDNLKNFISITDLKRLVKTLEKFMGLWEVSALSAVKKYAREIGVKDIYMVPAHVKAITASRSEYAKGLDTALEQIYDKIPSTVGFEKLPTSEVKIPSIKSGLTKYKGTYIWYAQVDNIRIAGKRVKLASALKSLKVQLSSILQK